MGTIADLILLLVLAAAVGVRLERWLQIFQQEHYEGARLQVWVGLHRREQFDLLLGAVIVGAIAGQAAAIADASGLVRAVVSAIAGGIIVAPALQIAGREQVKPLVWTPARSGSVPSPESSPRSSCCSPAHSPPPTCGPRSSASSARSCSSRPPG